MFWRWIGNEDTKWIFTVPKMCEFFWFIKLKCGCLTCIGLCCNVLSVFFFFSLVASLKFQQEEI